MRFLTGAGFIYIPSYPCLYCIRSCILLMCPIVFPFNLTIEKSVHSFVSNVHLAFHNVAPENLGVRNL